MKYSLKKQLRSFRYAWNGLRTCARNEQNLRFHLVAVVVATGAGWAFDISHTEWALVCLCIGLVIGAEVMNTAIERLVDLVSPQRQPLAGLVKDIAAGAVLVCAITAALVGVIIFWPYVAGLFG